MLTAERPPDDTTCTCGHAEEEHEAQGMWTPCEIDDCECGNFEEEQDD